MAEDGGCDGADVFAADVVATVKDGPGLRCQDEVLARSRSGPPAHVVANDLRYVAIADASAAGELDRVASKVIGDRHAANDLGQFQNVGSVEAGCKLRGDI